MIEDKLEHDERLRLECLAQAIASINITGRIADSQGIIKRAKEFEEFVKND